MPAMCHKHISSVITLGSCLTVLHDLSRTVFRSQQAFFSALFRGYHVMEGDLRKESNWLTSQSVVSRIMHNLQPLPWQQQMYYTIYNGDDHLRADIHRYLDSVVQTAKQHKDHITQLHALVEHSNNLEPQDRHYILDYKNAPDTDPLHELVFRMLRILIRYS